MNIKKRMVKPKNTTRSLFNNIVDLGEIIL